MVGGALVQFGGRLFLLGRAIEDDTRLRGGGGREGGRAGPRVGQGRTLVHFLPLLLLLLLLLLLPEDESNRQGDERRSDGA